MPSTRGSSGDHEDRHRLLAGDHRRGAETPQPALFEDRHHGRLEEDVQQYKHLEEPWRALHAATVIALDEARRHTRSPACSKQKMHKALLDEANQP